MNKEIQKERLALTILFSVIIFSVFMISMMVGGIIGFYLMKTGVLEPIGVSRETGIQLFLVMLLLSLLTGGVVTYFISKISMQPINRMINNFSRLAEGDFSARLTFGWPIGNHSAFQEISCSFNKLAEELENTELLRNDFVNNFSHEFKTPIVSIAGFAKLLRRGNLEPTQQEEYLEIIEEESLRLAAMANNVLSLTKVENQNILTGISTYNLSEQIRSCIVLLEQQWSRKNLVLDLSFEEYMISANEEMLKQVWVNLLDNAIKFSEQDGTLRVTIGAEIDGLHVAITNWGVSIPKEKQMRIFQKFYQADESHATQGNGVGLAVVKKIVELHEGIFYVNSDHNETTFEVLLPYGYTKQTYTDNANEML